MATGTSPPTTPPPLPPSFQPDEPGYGDFVDEHLAKVRNGIRVSDFFGKSMGLAALVLVYLLALIVIDHWVFDLSMTARLCGLVGLFIGSGFYIIRFLLPDLLRKINPAYAAKMVENVEPSFHNSLINLVMLRPKRQLVRPVIYDQVEQQAATRLASVDVADAVDQTPLIRLALALLGAMILFAAYTILSPKSPFQSIARIANPFSDVARPALVRISDIQPRNATVFAGESVEVSAVVELDDDSEAVWLVYSTTDGQQVDVRRAMTRDPVSMRHVGKFSDEGTVSQTIDYRIMAGDAEEGPFRISVSQAPTIFIEEVRLEYPAYTQMPSETFDNQADIRALEGTRVTVRARTNLDIESARIELDPSEKSPTVLPMTSDGRTAEGSFYVKLREDRRTPLNGAYQLTFTTSDGEVSKNPVEYKIEVLPDLSPSVEILTPELQLIEIPENSQQTIEIRALDPDFGLTDLHLQALQAAKNRTVARKIIEHSLLDDPGIGQRVVKFVFRPREYDLKAGDEVVYRAVARDNHTDAESGALMPNVSQTPSYSIIIGPPRDVAPNESEGLEGDDGQDGQPEPNGSDDGQDADGLDDGEGEGEGANGEGDDGEGADGGGTDGEGTDENQGAGEEKQNEGGGEGEKGNEGEGQDGESMNGEGEQGENGKAGENGNQKQPGSGNKGEKSGGNEPGEGGEAGAQEKGDGGEQDGEPQEGPGDQGEGGGKPSDDAAPGGEAGEQGADPATNAKGANQDQQGDPSGKQPNEGGKPDQNAEADDAGEPIDSEGSDDPEAFERILERMKEKFGEQKDGTPKPCPNGECNKDGDGEGSGDSGSKKPEGANEDGEGKDGEGKDGEGKDGEGKDGEGKDGEGKDGEGKDGEGKDGEGKDGEGKDGEGKDGEGKDGEGKDGEGKDGEGKDGEGKDGEGKDGEGKDGEGKDGEGKDGEGKDGEGKDGEGKDGEGKDGEGKDGEGKDGEGKDGEGKDGEGKDGEGKDGEGKDGEGKDGEGKDGEGKDGEGKDGEGKDGEGKDGEGKDGEPQGGDQGSKGSGADRGASDPLAPKEQWYDDKELPEPGGDDPNLEYARKATDLALDYLKHNQDKELQEDLGWTDEQMRRFADRWQQLQDEAVTPDASSAESELNDALRSLGLRRGNDRIRRAGTKDDQTRVRDSGNRSKPPAEYAEQYRAYLRSLGKRPQK